MTSPVRLSASPIWDLQRRYFAAQGPRAWSDGAVPFQVTSNPYLARAFADVIVGFARDLGGSDGGPDRPLFVVELGAGSGRFGYRLCRALCAAFAAVPCGRRPVYVMTDLAEANVAWWQQHPSLTPLLAQGVLDVARFDLARDRRLELRGSGRVVSATEPFADVVFVANYVFDSLPHDAFDCDGGALAECLVLPEAPAGDIARDGFREVPLRYLRHEIEARGYYGDPARDGLLERYRGSVEGTITVPVGALDALETLGGLARGPSLVLATDKGSAHLDGVVANGPPGAAVHGSFSMSVNFHAIGAWVEDRGGTWMHAAHHHRSVDVCAFAFGAPVLAETIAAYDRSIAQRGPDDFQTLRGVLRRTADEMTLPELLAYLRFSGFDAKIFAELAPRIVALLPTSSARDRADLSEALAHVEEWDFPLTV
jgi:hypothetical protein